jgi:hypothetical protein
MEVEDILEQLDRILLGILFVFAPIIVQYFLH